MKQSLTILLFLLSLAFTSCGGDDEPTINTTKDPDGTVTVNVNQGETQDILNVSVGVDKSYNLYYAGRYFSSSDGSDGELCMVGPMKGIGGISATETSLKNMTWNPRCAAHVGYGYILKKTHYSFVQNDDGSTKTIDGVTVIKYTQTFYAVYVNAEIGSTSGGVLGYEIKVRKLLEITYEDTKSRY